MEAIGEDERPVLETRFVLAAFFDIEFVISDASFCGRKVLFNV
jgi:hypothetical protein